MSDNQPILKRVGAEVCAADMWTDIGQTYAGDIDNSYHRHRLSVIEALLPAVEGKSVLDFGCGEGVLMRRLHELGASQVTGVDPDPKLIDLAQASGLGDATLGDVHTMQRFGRVDCILCANVLAYMRHDEELTFYSEARRLLAGGGSLVVTHSNELFDLFTFNAFTRDFFAKHFAADIADLLTRSTIPARATYNIRENPLTYADKLATLGFEVKQMEFINFHPVPPGSLLETDKTYNDTLDVPQSDRWKLMFQCSTFGVRAVCP